MFAMPPGEITDNVQMGDIERWDSLGHVELMLALEQSFRVEITAEAMTEILSLPDIEDYIRKRTGARI